MSDRTTLDRLSEGVKDVREALQIDGADVEVLGLDGTVAKLRLVVGPETCLECILPKDFLEQMILSNVQAALPEVTSVTLDDPRAAEFLP